MMKKIILIVFLFIVSVYANPLLLVTLESPPAEYLKNNNAIGINVDIVSEALNRLGYDVKIKFYPWKRALKMVEQGDADGIIDVAYNKTRAKYLYFPKEEIYTENWYCFTNKSSKLTLDTDFKNAKEIKLGVARAFVYGGAIQKAIDNNMFKYIDEGHDNIANIKKLLAKRFDMFPGVKNTILFEAKRLGVSERIRIVKKTKTDKDFLLSSSKTYLGFSKKRIPKNLAEKFSKTIAQMKADGTIENIHKKYY